MSSMTNKVTRGAAMVVGTALFFGQTTPSPSATINEGAQLGALVPPRSPTLKPSSLAALDNKVPRLDLSGAPLHEAIGFVQDLSKINIHVDWKAVEATGISRDTPINIKLRDVSLRKALNLMLSEAGGATLASYMDENVLKITTREVADSHRYVVVYPVADLLIEGPEVDGSIRQGLTGGAAAAGRNFRDERAYTGSPGGSRMARNPLADGFLNMPTMNNPPSRTSKADELIQLIEATVQPDSWASNGGKGTIRFFNGNLVVCACYSVHQALGGSD